MGEGEGRDWKNGQRRNMKMEEEKEKDGERMGKRRDRRRKKIEGEGVAVDMSVHES